MGELEHLANRGYTEGFYRRHVPSEFQNYVNGNSTSTNQQFVGEVTDYDAANGWLTIDVKNRFEQGDELELMTPQGNMRFNLEQLENLKGEKVDAAPGSGHTVRVPFNGPLPVDALGQYGLLMRYL
jgi:putative protease